MGRRFGRRQNSDGGTKSNGPDIQISHESTKTSPIKAESTENLWPQANLLGGSCKSTGKTAMVKHA